MVSATSLEDRQSEQLDSEPGPRTASRILVIIGDPARARTVCEALRGQRYELQVELRGDLGLERILAERPDGVVVDVDLPDQSGLEVCRRCREDYAGSIVLLASRGEEIDEVLGFELGADDVLTGTLRPRVLLARLRRLLTDRWRERGVGADGAADSEQPATAVPERAEVRVGAITINPHNRCVWVNGALVALTTAEFDLLWLLARNAGATLDRDQIFQELRGIEYDGLDRSMDLRVARLRKKLGDDSEQPRFIKSVRGVGYMLMTAF